MESRCKYRFVATEEHPARELRNSIDYLPTDGSDGWELDYSQRGVCAGSRGVVIYYDNSLLRKQGS